MPKSREPMVILKLGYMQIVLPDDTGVMQLMKTLKRGEFCRDYSWCDDDPRIEIDEEKLTLEMSYVKDGVPIKPKQPAGSRKPASNQPVRGIGKTPQLLLIERKESE